MIVLFVKMESSKAISERVCWKAKYVPSRRGSESDGVYEVARGEAFELTERGGNIHGARDPLVRIPQQLNIRRRNAIQPPLVVTWVSFNDLMEMFLTEARQ